MAILNNLYPPIMNTYAPAFLIDSNSAAANTCKVYFSFSAYNTIADIKYAQVTISTQNTNTSALNPEKYPSGIMLSNVFVDNTRKTDDKYYIKITKADMLNEKFEINQYYKVQIRFTSIDASDAKVLPPQKIDNWLEENKSLFSEWSSVCLVRGISTPSLSITNLSTTSITNLSTSRLDVLGKLIFADAAETEILKSYVIKLFDDNGNLVDSSGTLYNNNYSGVNEINHTFKYELLDGENYTVTIEYITQNLYSNSSSYQVFVVLGSAGVLDIKLTVSEDEENGALALAIAANDNSHYYTGNLTIRRTSSESNFTLWDDIQNISVENQLLNITWRDYTIKSGVWYKYCVQQRDSLGNRGPVVKTKEPIMVVFDHSFLTSNGKQLKIKFNPQVSSLKYVTHDSKTDTIGSKYPFVRRNGYTYYRQFPISGLISHFIDEDNIFTSREEMYGELLDLYDNYNKKNRITAYNDYTYERDFREKVMEFLYNNEVKLFRSPTEGNILVKITDVNLTPETVLGRMLYTFSCNANEIAETTIENYNKYNIQPIAPLDKELAYTENTVGQITITVPAGKNVLQVLQEKYQGEAAEGYIYTVDSLNSLSVKIEDKPYLIGENSAGVYIINDKEEK